MSLKPYLEYKESPSPLLGDIPNHWDVSRFRSALSIKKEIVGESWPDHLLLSLTVRGVIPRDMENVTGKLPADFTTYQRVRRDDLIFCLFDVEETPRTVGWVPQAGMLTGAYTAATPNRTFDSKYLAYHYLSYDQHKSLRGYYAGLRNTIRSTDFANIPICFPPLEEQRTIVEYLDRETAEIDAFIADQEELIALLEERRTASIAHAVTRGLDPGVPMKESSIEWVGQIPTHWRLGRLWTLFAREKNVGHPDEQMLSVFRDHGVVLKDSMTNLNQTAENRNIYQLVTPGWLVSNRMKAWQGSVGISTYRGIVSGHYICFRPKHNEHSPYLNYLFRSRPYIAGYNTISRGVRVGQAEIDNDKYRLLPVLLPPLSEQRRIAEHLDRETSDIQAAIADAREAIALSKERRAAVINAAVTGKIDVRGAVVPAPTNEVGAESVGVA